MVRKYISPITNNMLLNFVNCKRRIKKMLNIYDKYIKIKINVFTSLSLISFSIANLIYTYTLVILITYFIYTFRYTKY